MSNKVKQIILTIDYEIFFGPKSGTTENCMIKPTDILLDLLEDYNGKMTVFWDVLHYWRLKELSTNHPKLKKDKQLIEEQIKRMLSKGHDIQLHIHPHWLYSDFVDEAWKFNHDYYTLHDLESTQNLYKEFTINRCIQLSKETIESVCKSVDRNYIVNKFRAGGLRIEPFNSLRKGLGSNNIYIDSSVGYGLKDINNKYPYDFSRIPRKGQYRFSQSTHNEDENGYFIEFPISTIYINPIIKIYFYLLRKFFISPGKKYGDGIGQGFGNTRFSKIRKVKLFIQGSYSPLTTEGQFSQKINYLFRKAPSNSLMILHPKNMNDLQVDKLRNLQQNAKIQFKSIEQHIKELEIG